MTRSKQQRMHSRFGYTLMEMLLVQGVIVSMVAMSWPSLRGALDKSRLVGAARQVRTHLAQTRLKAIESGTVQQFRYVPGESRYETRPGRFTESASVGSIQPVGSFERGDVDGTGATESLVQVDSLADEIAFADPRTEMSEDTSDSLSHDQSDSTLSAEEGEWSAPIICYPNGRTSNARVRLTGPNDFYVDVTLRGLTGAATIGELKRNEEVE